MRGRRGVWLGLLGLASGCFTPAPADAVRRVAPGLHRPVWTVHDVEAPALRVRSVRAAGHLDERHAVRIDDHEFRFRERERWTEAPERYLERQLEASLFADAFRRSERTDAPSLTVTLIAFERIPGNDFEVAFTARLQGGDGTVFAEGTFRESTPCPGDSPADLARAAGAALSNAVNALVESLQSSPPYAS